MADELSDSVKERARLINKEVGEQLEYMNYKVLPRLLESQATKERKVIRLKEIASKALKLLGPYIPCGKGCSYCCHISMPISHSEAADLAKATGREMKDMRRPAMLFAPERYSLLGVVNTTKFMGVPCPFLGRSGECTVYEARPLPCRTHHVIEDDASRCDVSDGIKSTAKVDMSAHELAATAIFGDEIFADIREWFPPELP